MRRFTRGGGTPSPRSSCLPHQADAAAIAPGVARWQAWLCETATGGWYAISRPGTCGANALRLLRRSAPCRCRTGRHINFLNDTPLSYVKQRGMDSLLNEARWRTQSMDQCGHGQKCEDRRKQMVSTVTARRRIATVRLRRHEPVPCPSPARWSRILAAMHSRYECINRP